jgi:ribosomal protein S18 acetylase RimI-like enzyme
MILRLELATHAPSLRAAAAVRAAAFAAVPPDRSPWARDAFIRGRTGDAWKALEARVAGTDPEWGGMQVVCLLATVAEGGGEEGAEADEAGRPTCAATIHLPALPPGLASSLSLGATTDPSCCLPGSPHSSHRRRWGVATLDVNLGARLPSERLVAEPPPPAGGGGGALAYLSNVSVAAPARRCGVGRALVQHAVSVVAPSLGAQRCAVHAGTPAAARLYMSVGFVEVARETAATARARGDGEGPRTLFVI